MLLSFSFALKDLGIDSILRPFEGTPIPLGVWGPTPVALG